MNQAEPFPFVLGKRARQFPNSMANGFHWRQVQCIPPYRSKSASDKSGQRRYNAAGQERTSACPSKRNLSPPTVLGPGNSVPGRISSNQLRFLRPSYTLLAHRAEERLKSARRPECPLLRAFGRSGNEGANACRITRNAQPRTPIACPERSRRIYRAFQTSSECAVRIPSILCGGFKQKAGPSTPPDHPDPPG
jgi:hypothetical protein